MAQPVAPALPAPVGTKKINARVVIIERRDMVSRFTVDAPLLSQQFNRGLKVYTKQASVSAAWRHLGIKPSDRVGIKITTEGGEVFSSQRALVGAIIDGLRSAGVSTSQMIVWDKYSRHMVAAGWEPQAATKSEPAIASVLPGAGFDAGTSYKNAILGRLIWGDLFFKGQRENIPGMGGNLEETGEEKPNRLPEQTSNESYYTTILTRHVDKLINVPVLSDSNGTGIYGCIASLALASVDNNRRFNGPPYYGDVALSEILKEPVIAKKLVLHVLDACIAQYAGGPTFNPNLAEMPGLVYISQDPVAIDSLALVRLENWRSRNNVDPISDRAKHVPEAGLTGIGEDRLEHIQVIPLQ